jgi:hypothetical protein
MTVFINLPEELNTHNTYSDFKMPNAYEQAKQQAEAAKKAEAERQRREDTRSSHERAER